MPATRLIALNANTGAYTPIAATLPARSVQIVEDASVVGQGLEIQYPADNYATINTVAAGTPVEITGAGHDGICGLPQQPGGGTPGDFNFRPADVYCQARSASGTATTVRVVEMEALL